VMQFPQKRSEDRKVGFHTARYNDITASAIRNIIPNVIPANCSTYMAKRERILKRVKNSGIKALKWLSEMIEDLSEQVNSMVTRHGLGTVGFLQALTTEQRKELFGAVFDQYPLWLVTQFRQHEKRSVDFTQIWSPVDSPDRQRLRSYYRLMFVEMGEITHQVRIVKGCDKPANDELRNAWKRFPSYGAVSQLNLGTPVDLPLN
jgi:hypothetical protein